jgi:hypothetical protein
MPWPYLGTIRSYCIQEIEMTQPIELREFRLIVAGGRDFVDYALLEKSLMAIAEGDLKNRAVSIVSGMARGADSLAVEFAKKHNVKLYEFPANWAKYGKTAGFKRNQQMAEEADGLLAFWDGQSLGTADMISLMEYLDKPVTIVRY